MDRGSEQKSSLGNDSKLNREKNAVTGVKTTDQRHERKAEEDEAGGQHKPQNSGATNKTHNRG